MPPPGEANILGGMSRITRPFQFLKLVVAGVVGVATGVWLLVDADLGAPVGPRQPTDYMPGVGALAAGLVILACAAWVAFRRPDR